jgi:hypothetical protein
MVRDAVAEKNPQDERARGIDGLIAMINGPEPRTVRFRLR